MILYFSLAAWLLLFISRYLASRDRLPPSPSRIPVIEDILKLGGEELWRRANCWGRELGELSLISIHITIDSYICAGALVCLRVFNTPFIFIERGEDVIELLNKRSHIYSDRPRLTVAGDM